MYTRDTELRRLQSNDVNRLAEALGFDGGRKLMETIPKHWNKQDTLNGGSHKLNGGAVISSSVVELKYRPEQIRLIEEATRQTSGCYFAEILIQEWSTSGRKHERPTVGLLLHLLIKADLWNAADFVAEHFLNEPAPERPLEGPGAKVDISIPTGCFESVAEYVNDSMGYLDTEALNVCANGVNSIADHNQDYYMKFSQFGKSIGTVPKPPPRAQRAARQQNILSQQLQLQQQQNIHIHQSHLQTTQTNNDFGTIVASNDHNRSKHESLDNQQQQPQHNFNVSISSTMTAHNIPQLSDLLQVANSGPQSPIISNEVVANEHPLLTLLEGSTNSSARMSDTPPAVNASTSSNIVPKISSTSNSFCDNLPLLTELNINNTSSADLVNGIAESYNNTGQQQLTSSCSPNVSSDGSRCSSLSNGSFDDDENVYRGVNASTTDGNTVDVNEMADENFGEISLPNLSVFGRQSPSNDSSLTNVTCTSGDNSFELSLNESSSTSTTDPTAQRK